MRNIRRLLLVGALTFAATLPGQQSGPAIHIQAQPPNAPGSRTPDGAVRVSGGVMAGQIVKRVMPACRTGEVPTGVVVMHAIIGTDGKIERLTLISGPPDVGYTASVMDAVRQWEYKPYLLNGQPVTVDTTITFDARTQKC
jgi:protein TonB